jgi:hypothetical protein
MRPHERGVRRAKTGFDITAASESIITPRTREFGKASVQSIATACDVGSTQELTTIHGKRRKVAALYHHLRTSVPVPDLENRYERKRSLEVLDT